MYRSNRNHCSAQTHDDTKTLVSGSGSEPANKPGAVKARAALPSIHSWRAGRPRRNSVRPLALRKPYLRSSQAQEYATTSTCMRRLVCVHRSRWPRQSRASERCLPTPNHRPKHRLPHPPRLRTHRPRRTHRRSPSLRHPRCSTPHRQHQQACHRPRRAIDTCPYPTPFPQTIGLPTRSRMKREHLSLSAIESWRLPFKAW